MSFQITLLDSDGEIQNKIYQAVREELNRLLKKNINKAEARIKQSVDKWIRMQPEVQSILDDGVQNSLHAQFGLLGVQGVLAANDIVASVIASINVKIKYVNNNLAGGVDFEIQPEALNNLLGLSSGFVASESDVLHWLNWLLLEGSNTIVYGYNYTPDSSGRSGGGFMVSGGVWRIPPQFAGTLNDNFITRALSNRDKELEQILRDVFE